MSSVPPHAQAKAAIGLAAVIIAAQIPTTLQEIEDPATRVILQLIALLVFIGLFVLMFRVKVESRSAIESIKGAVSLRPPKTPEDTPSESPEAKRGKKD
jgi:hypothetical protein